MLELFTDKMLHDVDDDTGEDYGVACNGFFVEKVLSDTFTSSETAVIVLYSRAKKKRFTIPLKSFTRSAFAGSIISKGLEYPDRPDFSDAVLTYAIDSKKQAPIELVYDRLGWYELNGKKAFLCSQPICANKVLCDYSYKQPEKIAPCGSFEEWREGLKPFLARPTVALALAIGASAAVIPLLKEAGVFSETPIFALIGRSSSYKTTMLKMMAGIYGKPLIGNGLIDTTIDTTSYFFSQLSKKQGVIHCVDDISAAQGHDFSNELYAISMGKSRGRLSPDGEPKEVQTWCTTMVYTGESSIFEQTNKNSGLYARLIEFSFEWLKEEDDIDSFYDIINHNSGVAIDPFVKALFKLSEQNIRSLFKGSMAAVCKEIEPFDGIRRRITQRFAILIMTLQLCNLAWQLDLEAEPVLALLKEAYENNLPPCDPLDTAIQSIREQIIRNGNLFVKESERSVIPQRAWGIYGTFKYRGCIWIMEHKMEEIAKTAGIPRIRDVQRELADRDFLVRDSSNHYIFGKTIDSDIKVRCYGVYVNDFPKHDSKLKKSYTEADKALQDARRKSLLVDEEDEHDNSENFRHTS